MKRKEIEVDYGYRKHKKNPLGCTVWVNCTDNQLGNKVMDKGKVLDWDWWQNKIQKGKKIHKKRIQIGYRI